jgi:hypothetical protein
MPFRTPKGTRRRKRVFMQAQGTFVWNDTIDRSVDCAFCLGGNARITEGSWFCSQKLVVNATEKENEKKC